MKRKPKRKLLIIVVCAIIAVVAVSVVSSVSALGEMRDMNPVDTGEILPGIYAIKSGFVNMFLIQADGKYIAIDAGMSTGNVKNSLAQIGVSEDDVAAVLLTHTHGDHIAALKLFGNATVYSAKQSGKYTAVADGETLKILGKSFRVVSAPGHADDSVCFLLDDTYLFAGDNLSLAGDTVGMFNSAFNKSDEQQRLDIEKIAGLVGVKYIITAHYGVTDKPVF